MYLALLSARCFPASCCHTGAVPPHRSESSWFGFPPCHRIAEQITLASHTPVQRPTKTAPPWSVRTVTGCPASIFMKIPIISLLLQCLAKTNSKSLGTKVAPTLVSFVFSCTDAFFVISTPSSKAAGGFSFTISPISVKTSSKSPSLTIL